MINVWLITGCSTGFGRELAMQVLQKGDHVVVTARNLADIQDIITQFPDQAIGASLDVTNQEDVDAVVLLTVNKFDRIDYLVNNAGIGIMGAIEETAEENVRKMFEVNFFGLDRMTRAVLPIFREQRNGYFINISSGGGIKSHPNVGFYCASKFAVEGYSEALAEEVRPLGINLLLVEPGPFRTDWAGRSAIYSDTVIEDYKDTAGKNNKIMVATSGKQPGDPVKAVQAILEVITAERPPLRLILGADAYGNAQDKIKQLQKDYSDWEQLTLNADYNSGDREPA